MQFGFAERFALGGFSWQVLELAAQESAGPLRSGCRRAASAPRCALGACGALRPPLFGFCRGDWQTRRFARRRGRSPPCQRVRY